MMTHLGRLLAVIVGLLLVVGAAVFLFFRSSIASEGVYRVATAVGLDAAAPERHVVPEGFQGWAVVHYGVEGAPPLREDEGALIVEYPATGRLETSTPAPEDEGFVQRGYYRQSADGLAPLSRVGEIWGEYSHRNFRDLFGAGASRSSGFFLGTLKEFRATEWPTEHREPEGIRE
jgi:hypothetical protein